MSGGWKDSDRRSELPQGWEKIRQRIFKRDSFQCTATDAVTGGRCQRPAEECDHIHSKFDHSDSNLRSLCHWHHSLRTAQQAAKAKRIKMDKVRSNFRREDPHPGKVKNPKKPDRLF